MRLPSADAGHELPHRMSAARGTFLCSPRPRAVARAAHLALLLSAFSAAQAQVSLPSRSAQGQGPQGLSIRPYVSAEEILTDNFDLSAANKASDAITRLTAGLELRSRAGRVQGTVDYSLSTLIYASHGGSNTTQHQLNADVDAEWYERQGFLRIGASIQQAARSAFQAAPRAGGLPGSNTTELRTLRIAPRWQGLLFRDLRYTLQGEAATSSTSDTTSGKGSTGLLAAHVEPFAPSLLSWSVDLIQQESDFDLSRSSRTSRAYGSVIWQITDLDLRLNANGGMERSNLISLAPKDYGTWGFGLQWVPSPRTRFSALLEQRSFGKSHQVSGEYRTPRTVWQLSNTRSVTTSGSTLGFGQQGNLFSLLFAQFASVEPDFGRRADRVRAYLDSINRTGSEIVSVAILRSAATIDNRSDFSALWTGPRSSAALNLARTASQRADRSTVAGDDLALSKVVNQNVLTLLLSHRLTPEMNFTLTARAQSAAGSDALQRSQERGLTAQLSGRLSRYDSWSLLLRHTNYETSLVPYSESALVATYGLRF